MTGFSRELDFVCAFCVCLENICIKSAVHSLRNTLKRNGADVIELVKIINLSVRHACVKEKQLWMFNGIGNEIISYILFNLSTRLYSIFKIPSSNSMGYDMTTLHRASSSYHHQSVQL